MLRFRVLRMVMGLVGLLPIPWASRLGRILGVLAYHLFRGERDKALRSLAQAFPEKDDAQHRAIARASFAHLGAGACELACTRTLERELGRYVDFPPEAQATLLEVLGRGKGLVFSTGHVGNWELLARAVGQLCEVYAVGREKSDPNTTRWVEEMRAHSNVRTVWRGQPNVARELLRTLRAGKLLALLIDQDTRVQSVFVPFFGRLAATPRAAAELTLRTGAALIAGYCQRVGAGPRYRITLREVIPVVSQDTSQDVHALTAELTRDIESAIRRYPEQWVWMHQRWRTQPETSTEGEAAAPAGAPPTDSYPSQQRPLPL
jgi:KDO2-lipid IV(A) lauroyltransferase